MPAEDAEEAWQICSGFDADRESSLSPEEFSKVSAADPHVDFFTFSPPSLCPYRRYALLWL